MPSPQLEIVTPTKTYGPMKQAEVSAWVRTIGLKDEDEGKAEDGGWHVQVAGLLKG